MNTMTPRETQRSPGPGSAGLPNQRAREQACQNSIEWEKGGVYRKGRKETRKLIVSLF